MRPMRLLVANAAVLCTAVLAQADAGPSSIPAVRRFAAAVVLHPQQALEGNVGKAAFAEIAKAADKRIAADLFKDLEGRYGVNLRDVREIVVLLDVAAVAEAVGGYVLPPPVPDGGAAPLPPRSPVFVIRLAKPPDRKTVLAAWTRVETREVLARDKEGNILGRRFVDEEFVPKAKTHNGQTYYDNGVTSLFIDKNRVIGGPESVLKSLIAKNIDELPLVKAASKLAAGHQAALLLDVKRLAASIARAPRVDLPRHVVRLLDLTPKIARVTALVDCDRKLNVTLTAETADAKTAQELEKLARVRLLPLAGTLYELRRPSSVKYSPPAWKPLVEFFDAALDSVQVRRAGRNVVVSVDQSARIAALGRLIGRYFVAEHKREARKTNLRSVAFAMQFYHEVHTRLSTHGSDAAGKHAGLSWRVHLLPYMDEAELYKQFKLDEAWDSPHNRKLIAKMPAVFKTPGVTAAGKTSLHVFVGPGTPFGGKTGLRMIDVKDGAANTLMAVEAGPDKAKIWTKPGGLKFDPKSDPWKLLGKTDPVDGFLAAMLDGSVYWMRTWTPPETLRRLIQHADGKPTGEF